MAATMLLHFPFLSEAETEPTVIDGASYILVDFFLVSCSHFLLSTIGPSMVNSHHLLSRNSRSACSTVHPVRYAVHLRIPGVQMTGLRVPEIAFFVSHSVASISSGVGLALHALSKFKASIGGHVAAEWLEPSVAPEAINGRYCGPPYNTSQRKVCRDEGGLPVGVIREELTAWPERRGDVLLKRSILPRPTGAF